MYDSIIIGAGSSGLYCAQKLASASFKVLIIEQKKEIGKNIICTGIVSKRAFEEFKLNPGSILMPIKQMQIISPCGNHLIYEHPDILSYVVDRELFNKNLAMEAQAKGAELLLNASVEDICIRKDYVIIQAKHNELGTIKIESRSAIIATGINYNLSKKLNLGYPKNFLKGWQAEIFSDDIKITTVFLDNKIAFGGFAWAVPLPNGIVRLGLMTEDDKGDSFDSLIKYINIKNYQFDCNSRLMKKPIAQGLVSNTFADRILIIGEAAGQVKTTTGGGIYFGLLCSAIAADVLIDLLKKDNLSSSALSEYEKLWKKTIRNEIVMGYYLRKLYSHLSEDIIEKIFKIIKSDGILKELKFKIDFDWHIDAVMLALGKIFNERRK